MNIFQEYDQPPEMTKYLFEFINFFRILSHLSALFSSNSIKYWPCLGVGAGLCPMYVTEIAPLQVRGAMGVLYTLGQAAGLLTSQVHSSPFTCTE